MVPSTMSSPGGVLIREMNLADIPAGLGLCRVSRWNQTERDWQHFLMAAPHGALVAVENGLVVGTVATLPYGPFAWISMMLVDPAVRGRGIGTLLLNRGLALVPEAAAARLDATPAGEVLYRRLGFVPEYGLARFSLDVRRRGGGARSRPRSQARALGRKLEGTGGHRPGARPLAPVDWPALYDMDTGAFGASRATLLERLAGEAPEYAWVVERHGDPQGYLLGRHGHVREHLGPLIADTAETAGLLLEACLAAHPDREVVLDVPDDQQAWRAELAELGFVIERPFLRMYRGRRPAPGEPSRVYAITGPEFG
jgi:GNAT superfamily N-acetyltransferase